MIESWGLSAFETLCRSCAILESGGIDYRVTGLTASNLYGHTLTTNVLDIAVESDSVVTKAVQLLGLPLSTEVNPYVYTLKDHMGFIRIQADILGKAFVHSSGLWLHSKDLLLDRLDIYANDDSTGRICKAVAFIALTVDSSKVEQYRRYWNKLGG